MYSDAFISYILELTNNEIESYREEGIQPTNPIGIRKEKYRLSKIQPQYVLDDTYKGRMMFQFLYFGDTKRRPFGFKSDNEAIISCKLLSEEKL